MALGGPAVLDPAIGEDPVQWNRKELAYAC